MYLSHEDVAELRRDGYLSRKEREHAQRLDRERGPAITIPDQPAAEPDRPWASDDELIARMAREMAERASGIGEACTDADLIRAGFTPDEIRQHGTAARRAALGISPDRAIERPRYDVGKVRIARASAKIHPEGYERYIVRHGGDVIGTARGLGNDGYLVYGARGELLGIAPHRRYIRAVAASGRPYLRVGLPRLERGMVLLVRLGAAGHQAAEYLGPSQMLQSRLRVRRRLGQGRHARWAQPETIKQSDVLAVSLERTAGAIEAPHG